MIPIIEKSKLYAQQTAIIDVDGVYTYDQLREQALRLAGAIAGKTGGRSVPVLFLAPSGFMYVAIKWGIWLAGGIAVPVHVAHPPEEIAYLIADTGTTLLLCDEALMEKAQHAAAGKVTCMTVPQLLQEPPGTLPEPDIQADALMIYTSGTTGKPKGVVISHQQLDTQLRSLSESWGWQPTDRILNILPMHHVHGVVNITCCALYNGAVLELQSQFDAAQVAARMTSGELTLFMAVPTIYHKLTQHFRLLPFAQQQSWQEGMSGMRLMVSGSAALPVTLLEEWRQISGHTLLERYGMTEIGMALSNPLEGRRRPGYVGMPLPYVQVKLVDEQGQTIVTTGTPGELYVSGDTVFQRYWNRPEETERSFDAGWFKTGDIAEKDTDGYYRILGRNSSDIIKSGGYKISALEIENVLLEHPDVAECAVVALPSEEWGETIAATIVGDADPEILKAWLKGKLAPYKMPRQIITVEGLPRNAMGKVLKTQVKQLFGS